MTSQDTSNEPEGLDCKAPAPGSKRQTEHTQVGMTQDASSSGPRGMDVSNMDTALNEVIAGINKGPLKRVATDQPAGFNRDNWKKQFQLQKAKLAAEAEAKSKLLLPGPAVAKASTATPVSGPPKDGNPTEADERPFSFVGIPKKPVHLKCAISLNEKVSIGNPRGNFPLGYSLMLTIYPSRLGMPCLYITLRVNTEDPRYPFDTKRNFETVTITWEPAAKADGHYEMEHFKERSYTEWAAKRASAPAMTLPFMEGFDITQCNLRTLRLQTRGGKIESSGLGSLQHLEKHTLDVISTLFSTKEKMLLVFFMAPQQDEYAGILHPFQHCVDQRRGMFHQYRENGIGQWLLTSGPKVQTVQEVGGGMYVNPMGGFLQLPTKLNYRNVDEFMVYCSLTPLREEQYHIGRDVLLRQHPLEVLMVRPRLNLWKDPKAATSQFSQEHKDLGTFVLAYVRLPSRGNSDLMPDTNSSISLEWDNPGVLTRKHQKGGIKWTGVVVPREAREFQESQTDFCVCLRMPHFATMNAATRPVNRKSLPKAWLEVSHNFNLIWREMEAAKKLWISDRPEHVAFLKHLALDDETAKTIETIVDLSEGIQDEDEMDDPESAKKDFEAFANHIKENLENDAQSKVIDALKGVVNGYMGVAGPSGTGKTTLINNVVWLLVYVGHKLAVCTPSNTAADHNGKSICESQPRLCPDKKTLRLEVSAIERMRSDIGNPEEEWSTRPSPSSMSDTAVEQDPRLEAAYSLLMSEHFEDAEKREEFEEFQSGFEQFDSNVKDVKRTRMRQAHVPNQITLGYHIRALFDRDLAAAEKSYDEKLKATHSTKHKDLLTVNKRNKSHSYMEWYNYWLRMGGKLDDTASEHWSSARQEMERRVMAEIDILIITLKNAGSVFADLGFNPSVILVDEAGQATHASLFVPMVTFKNYKAILLFGDPQQLEPIVMAKAVSEVVYSSRVSALKLMYRKGRNTIVLTEQYRMAPAILSFPARHFYGGILTCNAKAREDNPWRQAVRKVSLEFYGIKGESNPKDGSELFMIDVVRSSARIEPNGTSLVNHGNADAVNLAVQRLLAVNIPPEDIIILTLYKAQMKLITSKIGRAEDGRTVYKDISTIDAFQGRESRVIVLDLVVARDYDDYRSTPMFQTHGTDTAEDGEEDEELVDVKIRTGQKYDTISAFARDPHRICVALTRARDGSIIVGQQSLLLHSTNTDKDIRWNTLNTMVRDLRKRKLIHSDTTTLDSHPDAIKERHQMSAAEKKQREERTSEARRYAFINNLVRKGRYVQPNQNSATNGLFGTMVDDTAKTLDTALPAQSSQPPRPSPAEYEASRNTRGGQGPNRWGGQQTRGGGKPPRGDRVGRSNHGAKPDLKGKGKEKVNIPQPSKPPSSLLPPKPPCKDDSQINTIKG